MRTKEKPSGEITSADNILAVKRFLTEMNWAEFLARVTESAAPEMEAYERARAKSLQTTAQHVFM